jgi:hypothetical protein
MEKLFGDPLIKAVTPGETLQIVAAIFSAHFPNHNAGFFSTILHQVQNIFACAYSGYQRCDMAFHDFAHTCQATVATVRILDGHLKSGRPPALTPREFQLAVVGILLHDIGFSKETGDDSGAGAKYTTAHVDRGERFAAKFHPHFRGTPDEVRVVQLTIRSTTMNVAVSRLPFRDERERLIGCAVGTGDILGTMAAPDYPERLPGLYQELAEAAVYAGPHAKEVTRYQSAEDLLRKTRDFYHSYVQRMLEEQWGGIYKALEYHFADGRNHYLQAIETNLARIDRILVTTKEK